VEDGGREGVEGCGVRRGNSFDGGDGRGLVWQ